MQEDVLQLSCKLIGLYNIRGVVTYVKAVADLLVVRCPPVLDASSPLSAMTRDCCVL